MSSLNLIFSPGDCQEILAGLPAGAVGLDLRSNSAVTKPEFENEVIRVFTDGSCLNNGKKNSVGGIGIHFPDGQMPDVSLPYSEQLIAKPRESNSPKKKVTNQQAELAAIYHALKIVNNYLSNNRNKAEKIRRTEIHIYTDSTYAINSLTNWCYTWKNNHWKTANGKPVKNRHLIESLLELMKKTRVKFFHAEAHTNRDDDRSRGNARADFLATQAAKKTSNFH
jgi:ribonuclease HI